jgi:MFS family permease
VTGGLLDRFAPVAVAVAMLAVASAGAFVLAAAQSLPMGILASACLGFGSGGETDVIPYLLSRYFGVRSLSALYGINWTAWGIAGAVGPTILGRAFDATGSYSVVLTGLGAMALLAVGLMFTLPAPRSAPSIVSAPV